MKYPNQITAPVTKDFHNKVGAYCEKKGVSSAELIRYSVSHIISGEHIKVVNELARTQEEMQIASTYIDDLRDEINRYMNLNSVCIVALLIVAFTI